MLSACWSLGALCLSLAVFLLAATCRHSMTSSLCCLVASLILAFACLEAWMLGTEQVTDGLVDDTAQSRYVQTGQAERHSQNTFMPYGTFPAALGHPYYVAQRVLRFDRILFDVRYGFDALGHRVTPLSTQPTQAEILVFGCSFSFGHGLEDEETWAWLLGKALGPAWRITNYAYKGFGAQQMLTLLEEGVVSKPESNAKAAVFLALHHHVRRNDGLLEASLSRRYALNEHGQLYTAGWSKDRYSTLYTLPKFFNGSQLVQHCCSLLQGAIVKQKHDTFLATYVAMLEKSSHLLREKYGIPLTILLWPDIEYIAPALQEKDIAFLKVRDMLPLWDESKGEVYYIAPRYETHPNSRAAQEIATALARYYRPLLP